MSNPHVVFITLLGLILELFFLFFLMEITCSTFLISLLINLTISALLDDFASFYFHILHFGYTVYKHSKRCSDGKINRLNC